MPTTFVRIFCSHFYAYQFLFKFPVDDGEPGDILGGRGSGGEGGPGCAAAQQGVEEWALSLSGAGGVLGGVVLCSVSDAMCKIK